MSERHPIVAVTGSSGSGTSRIMAALREICRRENARMGEVDGDGFHRYDREEFSRILEDPASSMQTPSYFSPNCNLFDKLDALLQEYSVSGTGHTRRYLHDEMESQLYGQPPGTFTAWGPLPDDTDLLVYSGLHGCFVDDEFDIASYMDLKIGVVPIVNLEWIRKIHRDMRIRGFHPADVSDTILRRLPDYLKHITPQFSRTDINFQRVPIVDTSNPFAAPEEPGDKETVVVIRVAHPERNSVDFPYLLKMIPRAFMSRRNSIVVPGNEIAYAMELVLTPFIHDLIAHRRAALQAA